MQGQDARLGCGVSAARGLHDRREERVIETVGLLGLGLLGRGIAACLVGHGYRVIAFTRRASTHAEARQYIDRAIDDLVAHAGFPAALRESWPRRFEAVDTLAPFAHCDFVIESIVEDLAAKEAIFDEIEARVGEAVPIASNTSAIPIGHLQGNRKKPARFLGMHWAEPAHATRFLELIRGPVTSDEAFAAAAALGRAVGKEPCLVQKDVPAFIVNRIGYAMYREALHILELGVADAETIDRSCRNALGLWATMCGPLRWIDLTGGPAAYAEAIRNVLPTLSNDTELPDTLAKLAASDARGMANGRGFYQYDAEESAAWEALFREHAWNVRALMDKYFPLDEP
jgi:3-hydroxybutyryl-CoA dehydrogenase